jgi:hypothetical protein
MLKNQVRYSDRVKTGCERESHGEAGEVFLRSTFYSLVTANVRFEVFTAVTMKNGVFCDVTPCGSCKNHTA